MLLVETSNAYARGLLEGIVAYLREHHTWSVHLAEQSRGDAPPQWLTRWKGDGIIARIETPVIARAVTASGLPVVDLSAARQLPKAPWVETNDTGIARLAVDHLLQRGFKHLAYCGDDRFNWSHWRSDHFARMVGDAGFACSLFQPPRGEHSPARQETLIADWLKRLPKPLGVMACYDIRGKQVLDACRSIGLAVPDEVAVIGVDNDALLCELSEPPLSSVIPNTRLTGYTAAALLDRLMAGKPVDGETHLIEPLGVTTRRSTDVLAIEDREVSEAIRFIRDHACEGIGVEDVLRVVPLSRRVLESRFRKLIGRTPHDEILKVRLERARSLLLETELKLAQIAQRAGFQHTEYLTVVFKKKFGLSPSEYRRSASPRTGAAD